MKKLSIFFPGNNLELSTYFARPDQIDGSRFRLLGLAAKQFGDEIPYFTEDVLEGAVPPSNDPYPVEHPKKK